jgi:hypothetical protein
MALSLCLTFDIRVTVLKNGDFDLRTRVFFIHEDSAAIVRGKDFVVVITNQSRLNHYVINRLKVIGEVTGAAIRKKK